MSDPIRPITSVGTSLKRGVEKQLEKVRPKADEIQPEETFSEKLERNLNRLEGNLHKPTLVEKKPLLNVSKPPFDYDKKNLLFPEKKLDLMEVPTAEEKLARYQAGDLRTSILITQKQLEKVKTKLDYLTKGAAGYEQKQAELLQRQIELEIQLKQEQSELDRLSRLAGGNFNLLA